MQIRLHPTDRTSRRRKAGLQPSCRLHIAGPRGSCFYKGFTADADWRRRRPHGARDRNGLSLSDAPQALACARSNVDYIPVALDAAAPNGGDIAALALAEEAPRVEYMVSFLCGGDSLVKRRSRDFFMAGVSLNAFRSDALTPAG